MTSRIHEDFLKTLPSLSHYSKRPKTGRKYVRISNHPVIGRPVGTNLSGYRTFTVSQTLSTGRLITGRYVWLSDIHCISNV